MTLLPSRRLLTVAAVIAAVSFAVLIFPAARLLLLAVDLFLTGAVLFDALITPGPGSLEVERIAPDHMSVVNEHAIALVVRSRARAALNVRLRDTIPAEFRVTDKQIGGRVAPLGEARWQYTVEPLKRGRFMWGSIHLRYRSLLGFWERGKAVPATAEARVYPNLVSLQRYHLLARANRLEALGIRKVRLRGGSFEFESLREYATGDDVRLLDWKATARRSKLIVRNQEAERNQTVLLLVDSGRLMNAEENGVAKLDHAVNSALLLAHVALARGDRVGLCTFSAKVHAWLAPRGHLSQNRLVTDALYDLRGDFTESDHGRALKLVASRYPKRSLLVVLTDFVDATTAADMVAHLQLAARRHLVLFAALKDPFLERAARSVPATALDGFRKAAAVDLLRERRSVLERIRQMGGFVIDAEPTGVTPPLINRYLEVTFRGLL